MAYRDINVKRAKDRAYWRRVRGAGPPPTQLPIGTVQALDIPVPRAGLKIAVLPDAQVMEGVDMRHLTAYGRYVANKQPDVIVCIGDFGDFPSLSRFDRGTMAFEGRRYKKDLGAFHRGMELFMTPIAKAIGGRNRWRPYMEFCRGNHEDHIRRAVQEDPKLEGLIDINADLRLPSYGWREHEFLFPVSVGGVAFCHYYPSGQLGRPIGTARAILTKLHMSAVAGHQQGRDIAYSRRADGGSMAAIICGSFYSHSYTYLSPFTNAHWRGAYFLHETRDGRFDEMALSLDFLVRRYL